MPASASFAGSGVAPTVVSATNDGLRTIRVQMSEAVQANAALGTVANYTLTALGGSTARTVLAAARDARDATVIVVTVSGDLTTGASTYTIEVDGVSDLAGNVIGGTNTATLSVDPDSGDVLDHEALALRRLISQYREQPNIESVLRIMAGRIQALDQEAANVGGFRGIDSAYGVGLDKLGALLRLARGGLSDAVYRVRLRAAAQVTASHGYPDEVLAVLVTLLDGASSPTFAEHYPAAVVLEAADIPNADGWAFTRLLLRAVAAGVQLILLHSEDDTLLGWDGEVGAGPWAEIADDPSGGLWAEASGLPGAA